jgi:mono/diheme cytochrome c family protein
MPPPAGPPLADGLLAWDGDAKESTVLFGATQTSFVFSVTNVSPKPITITSVYSSCGCTIAKLPAMPWTLAPGAKGSIDVVMNLAGKRGINIKSLTIITDNGQKALTVRTNIQEPSTQTMSPEERAKNLLIASANRQSVLHGNCAACHSAPAVNKMGFELYQAACTICHEAEHRAASVPDLKTLGKNRDADYWRKWITSSEQGKLMPAFAIEHGGILSSVQIESLVKYLTELNKPLKPAESPSPPPHQP